MWSTAQTTEKKFTASDIKGLIYNLFLHEQVMKN